MGMSGSPVDCFRRDQRRKKVGEDELARFS